jgi:uncharacterized membrane protein
MTSAHFKDAAEAVSMSVDGAGIVVIVVGLAWATVSFARRGAGQPDDPYTRYRQQVGKSILLGLEFLVAADIIRTVAVQPSFTSVGVLALIVIVRTFLSFTLELEVNGRWPWQSRHETKPSAPA